VCSGVYIERQRTCLLLTCAHSSAIIDDLQSGPDLLAYFYFATGQAQVKETFSILLRSWITQLARSAQRCFHILEASYKAHGQQPESGASEQTLRNLLLDLLRASPRALLVLDALDQCSDSIKDDVLSFLRIVIENGATRGADVLTVRLLMTSRDELGIRSDLRLLHPSIHVLDLFVALERQKDLEQYIDSELRRDVYKWKPATNIRVRQDLLAKADGM
jgi:hypothetical protein